ncbi:MAG TPA: hypothetical protein VM554_01790 [Acidisarcina sp.]|nr:hypothetical protein [Acidisarcina sp.]
MTTLDVVYRYATHPTEAEMLALGNALEVYGMRRLKVNRQEMTILVEYDATRLNAAAVSRLLRGAGISITEEVSLIPPLLPPPAAEVKDAAPAK